MTLSDAPTYIVTTYILTPKEDNLSIMLQGTRYEVGDIVSILDETGRVYYALLRGFLQDQYSEKYAALTWITPTTPNPKTFDPSLFILGKLTL